MPLNFVDYACFIGFTIFTIAVALYAGRKEKTSLDYFLAGRELRWWLVGFSLVATNISTEHFVGMSGTAYRLGLAVASFEWVAAPAMIITAIWILPKFLRCGIYTLPEFLEYRFSPATRAIVTTYWVLMYPFIPIGAVLFSGALAIKTIFGLSIVKGVVIMGVLTGVYTIYGGLKAVVWADMLQCIALLLGGALVTILGLHAIGGIPAFIEGSGDKLHMILPANHPDLPWTILLAGIWIPNIGYWGLNQFIVQRALAAKSLAQGQKGMLFGGALKLLIPFVILMPGIMAYQLYSSQLPQGDQAFPFMIKKLVPVGVRGIIMAALFGAVMSSLSSMLNSASTMFVMDLYHRHWRKNATNENLVFLGRLMTTVFLVAGMLFAPIFDRAEGFFLWMQKIGSPAVPGLVSIFLVGLFITKTPAWAAIASLLASPVLYLLTFQIFPKAPYLNVLGILVGLLVLFMAVVRLIMPLAEAKKLPVVEGIDMTPAKNLKWMCLALLAAVVALYIIFR